MTLRSIGVGALIVSLVIGMASNVLFLAAFQFRIAWFLDPTQILGGGSMSAELLRWAAAMDLIGYYLAGGVLAYVLWRALRPRNPVVADLATIAALGYALAGGAAAAVLAMVGPMLITDYASAGGSQQAVIATQFAVLLEVVWRSVWQFLDGIFVSAWWLGIGILVRPEQPGLSRLSYVMAAVAVVGAFFNLAGLGIARDVALGVIFTLWTVWWVWLLILFRRRETPFEFDDAEPSIPVQSRKTR